MKTTEGVKLMITNLMTSEVNQILWALIGGVGTKLVGVTLNCQTLMQSSNKTNKCFKKY